MQEIMKDHFFSMVNIIFIVSSIFIFLLRKWLLVEKMNSILSQLPVVS